ncbi:hypothetical protein [Candidiatus Paracoxiella cheracis]|uniref:hypothetical protein n=1 Tax=Candidiatus Paracoxiella cheracis TaxID=3405120 RepID=UPI003BF5835F
MKNNEHIKMLLNYEKILFGNGKYIVSIAVYETLGDSNQPPRYYDLLSRSFEFFVVNAEDVESSFHHPAEWEVYTESGTLLELPGDLC